MGEHVGMYICMHVFMYVCVCVYVFVYKSTLKAHEQREK